MTVPTLKHMYTTVYVVTDGENILDIFSEELQAMQYVDHYEDKPLQIIDTVLEVLV